MRPLRPYQCPGDVAKGQRGVSDSAEKEESQAVKLTFGGLSNAEDSPDVGSGSTCRRRFSTMSLGLIL